MMFNLEIRKKIKIGKLSDFHKAESMDEEATLSECKK